MQKPRNLYCMFILLIIWCSSTSLSSGSFDPIQVMCEINGFMIPAMIDTGAEISVMSVSCAKRCHISNCIDSRYAGKVIGVGSSEIVGGIDNLSFRIGPVNFQNKLSILRSSRCDFLIGLDVLRRFKCDISIGEKILKLSVRGNTIRVPILASNVCDAHSEIYGSEYCVSDSNHYSQQVNNCFKFNDNGKKTRVLTTSVQELTSAFYTSEEHEDDDIDLMSDDMSVSMEGV